MKKIILLSLIVITFFVNQAFAEEINVVGGDTHIEHFDKCSTLEVNVSGETPLVDGEYRLLNNCTEENDNRWICNCSDNFDLVIEFSNWIKNNYKFVFDFSYEGAGQINYGSSGGSSSSTDSTTTTTSTPPTIKLTGEEKDFILSQDTLPTFRVQQGGKRHTLRLLEIGDDYVIFEIRSDPITVSLKLGETKIIALDGRYLEITLNGIVNGEADIGFKTLEEVVDKPKETVEVVEPIEEPKEQVKPPQTTTPVRVVETESKGFSLGGAVAILVVIVLMGLCLLLFRHKKVDNHEK